MPFGPDQVVVGAEHQSHHSLRFRDVVWSGRRCLNPNDMSVIMGSRPATQPPEEPRSAERAAALDAYTPLLRRLAEGAAPDDGRSDLLDRALELWARPGFDTLVSLPRLRFEPFDYQVKAAHSVLGRMRGRAILADEVGLGKTIEASLVLSELRLRGLAGRALILAPPGLLAQWHEELDRKFALPSTVVGGARDWASEQRNGEAPIWVMSLAAARRSPLKDHLTSTRWDLVIVDEAHRLKNPHSASAVLLKSLRSRYLLLLTATPVENRLADLFQLVSLVAPGLLGSAQQFRARHGGGEGEELAAGVRNLTALRARTAEVMIRNRRSEVALMLPGRLAETIRVTPQEEEAELYRLVSDRVRRASREAPGTRRLALRNAQRLAGSSPAVLAPSLISLGWEDLAARARGLTGTKKTAVLLELLHRHLTRGEKVAVFTAFRQTLGYLAELFEKSGVNAAVYHGGLARRDKDQAIACFSDDIPVLLTTEAAGEGRNLQFCHVMINFDLPWNPMQIEQRLGRIHRIGQQREVQLTNLLCRGTIEEEIARLLQAKINLFELVIGELDMILGRIEDDFDFESFVFRTHAESATDAEFVARLDSFGDELARARRAGTASSETVDALVDPP